MTNDDICAVLIIKEAENCTMLDAVAKYWPCSSEEYITHKYNEIIKDIPLRRRMWVQMNINVRKLGCDEKAKTI